MSLPDFRYRKQINDRFAVSVINAKKQVLVDLHNLLVEEALEEQQAEEKGE